MLSLTRKTDYALVALARLAAAAGQPGHQPVSARDIAEQFDLPLPLTMNVLKRLHHAGLVESTRGAKGGYYLGRSPQAVRLTDVIEAIEGPVRVAACCGRAMGRTTTGDASGASVQVSDDANADCSVRAGCPITHAVRGLNEQIYAFLHHHTLADLASSEAATEQGWVPVAEVGRGVGGDREAPISPG